LLDLPADDGGPVRCLVYRAAAGVQIRGGEPSRFRSSARATRSFCGHCGTQLIFQSEDTPDEIDVTTCSLDDPEAEPPRDHTHVSSRLRWIQLCDGLSEHSEAR
jgi:hypothetical protein